MALFKINDSVRSYEDEKLEKVLSGAITQEQFIQLIAPDDPYVIVRGELRVLTEQDMENSKKSYIRQMQDNLKKTGGLRGEGFYAVKDKLLLVYPELKDDLATVQAQIEKEDCKGCAMNSKLQPVMQKLFGLPVAGRDLASLTGAVPPLTLRILKGETLTDAELPDILIPPGFDKRKLKQKTGAPAAATPAANVPRASRLHMVKLHLAEASACAKIHLLTNDADLAWQAIGHLQAAASEISHSSPEKAEEIRKIVTEALK